MREEALAERRLAGFVDQLSSLRVGGPTPWDSIGESLGTMLRGIPLLYGVSSATGRARVPYGTAGVSARQQVIKDLDDVLNRTGAFGFYRAAHVAPGQRNRVVRLCELTTDPRAHERMSLFRRYGVEQCDQLRVIISDGPTMRAWFGAFRDDADPFTEHDARLLRRALPAIRRRVDLESELRQGSVASAALEVALESMGRAAFIADRHGRLKHANTLARFAWDRGAAGLEGSMHPSSGRWDEHPLSTPGIEGHVLWLERRRSAEGFETKWALTAREREVLSLVARGLSNGAIAGHLECSERTVEAHVARLLEVSQCESRAQLVAELWRHRNE